MFTNVTQRWRERRDSYRPAGEPIDPRHYEVASIVGKGADAMASSFIRQHHYSGSYVAARFRFGLYWGGLLVGVAVFSQPVNDRTLDVIPGEREERVELGRFVLLDRVPANGETWFLARAFELLGRSWIVGVVSFSDPIPRSSSIGTVVFPGHVGTIYQAFNGVYLGRGTARTLRLLPDGTVLNDRSAQKVRARERGWEAVVELLERHGAARLQPGQDPGAWLSLWRGRLTRPLRHPGNHKYVWALDKRLRRRLPQGLTYPKMHVATR